MFILERILWPDVFTAILFQRAQEFSKSLKQAEKGKEAMRRA